MLAKVDGDEEEEVSEDYGDEGGERVRHGGATAASCSRSSCGMSSWTSNRNIKRCIFPGIWIIWIVPIVYLGGFRISLKVLGANVISFLIARWHAVWLLEANGCAATFADAPVGIHYARKLTFCSVVILICNLNVIAPFFAEVKFRNTYFISVCFTMKKILCVSLVPLLAWSYFHYCNMKS